MSERCPRVLLSPGRVARFMPALPRGQRLDASAQRPARLPAAAQWRRAGEWVRG